MTDTQYAKARAALAAKAEAATAVAERSLSMWRPPLAMPMPHVQAARADGYEHRAGRAAHLAKCAAVTAPVEFAADAPGRSASSARNGVIRHAGGPTTLGGTGR